MNKPNFFLVEDLDYTSPYNAGSPMALHILIL